MSNDESKINVLFVCLGNICRSTMAEGVFRSIAGSNARIGRIDSAGTGAYHTLDPPDYRTMATLRKNGITDYEHGARQVLQTDFSDFDYIFAMDAWNLRDLQNLQRRVEGKSASSGSTSNSTPTSASASSSSSPNANVSANGNGKTKAKVMLFGEFGGRRGKKVEEVGDPYYGAENGFDVVYEQVMRFSRNFVDQVVDGKGG